MDRLPPIRIEPDIDPTQLTWAEMRRVVTYADVLGCDSLWTYGADDPRQTIFEGWTTIAAWGAPTTWPTVGPLVGANTLQYPASVAKAAVTVDHLSGGRCILSPDPPILRLEPPDERLGIRQETIQVEIGGEQAPTRPRRVIAVGFRLAPKRLATVKRVVR